AALDLDPAPVPYAGVSALYVEDDEDDETDEGDHTEPAAAGRLGRWPAMVAVLLVLAIALTMVAGHHLVTADTVRGWLRR
ncbi:MAG TPA: hypothetical protein VGI06_10220, partial [Acidimicrobiales bacterium]